MMGKVNTVPNWLVRWIGYHHVPRDSTILIPDHGDGVLGICKMLSPCMTYAVGPFPTWKGDPQTQQHIRWVAEELKIVQWVV